MQIKPIHTEEDYEAAVARIESLINASPNTPEEDELDILSTLVAAYEEKHYPIPAPDPIEAIKFRMEQMGMTQNDLQKVFKSGRGRVSEILNKKRPLTLAMIRHLTEALAIPPEVLIQEYQLKAKPNWSKGTTFCEGSTFGSGFGLGNKDEKKSKSRKTKPHKSAS